MAEAYKIEARTESFIREYNRLKSAGQMVVHEVLKDILGVKSKTTISEILAKRQNIQPDQWEAFKSHFGINEINIGSELDRSSVSFSEPQELKGSSEGGVFLSMYKEANEARIKALEKHNEFLQRLVESSLNTTQSAALASLVYHKAWVERVARHESKGDSEKKEELLNEMDTIIAALSGDGGNRNMTDENS